MITVNSNNGRIKRYVRTSNKYYDEQGNLTSEDLVEEYEYFDTPSYNPPVVPGDQWWQNPVVSSSNTNYITDSVFAKANEDCKDYIDEFFVKKSQLGELVKKALRIAE